VKSGIPSTSGYAQADTAAASIARRHHRHPVEIFLELKGKMPPALTKTDIRVLHTGSRALAKDC
jgi:hypothetical protein